MIKYLEKTIRFSIKYFWLAIPMAVAGLIPGLITGRGPVKGLGQVWDILSMIKNPDSILSRPTVLFGIFSGALFAAGVAGFLGVLLRFLAYPATCGMINKAIITGKAVSGFNDLLEEFKSSLKENLVMYITFWVASLVVILVLSAACIALVMILGVMVKYLGAIGMLIAIMAFLAAGVIAVVISVLLAFWFPSMVVDRIGVVEAFRQSVSFAKSRFWSVLGIIVVIGLISGIIQGIVGTVAGIIPALTEFLYVTAYFLIYQESSSLAK